MVCATPGQESKFKTIYPRLPLYHIREQANTGVRQGLAERFEFAGHVIIDRLDRFIQSPPRNVYVNFCSRCRDTPALARAVSRSADRGNRIGHEGASRRNHIRLSFGGWNPRFPRWSIGARSRLAHAEKNRFEEVVAHMELDRDRHHPGAAICDHAILDA